MLRKFFSLWFGASCILRLYMLLVVIPVGTQMPGGFGGQFALALVYGCIAYWMWPTQTVDA